MSHEKHVELLFNSPFLYVFVFPFFIFLIFHLTSTLLSRICGHLRTFENKVPLILAETHQCQTSYVDIRWRIEFYAAIEITPRVKH